MATASNAEKKTNGKCPDGYEAVWTWCFKKSIIDKLEKPLEDIKIPDFTDPSCEAALSALKSIESSMSSLMALPKKYLGMLGSLLNYPFNVAQNMINTAMNAINNVSKAIDDLLKGSGLKDLENAMNSMLQCSFLADSEIGKLAASILDAIKSGTDVTGLANQLKNMLNSTLTDALNNLKKTPTQALNNINKAIDNLIKQLGLDDIIKNMKKLEQCVDSLCKAYKSLEKFQERMPSSADDLLKSGGMSWDSATQSVTNAATSIVSQGSSAVTTVTTAVVPQALSALSAASAVATLASGVTTTTTTITVDGDAVSGIVHSVTTVSNEAPAETVVSTVVSGTVDAGTGEIVGADTTLLGGTSSTEIDTALEVAEKVAELQEAADQAASAGNMSTEE